MTKDEIKKALKCCDSHIPSACGDCPYCWVEECKDKLITDALALITEQEEDIEQLEDVVVKAFTNGFTYGQKGVEKDIIRAKIDVLNELKEKLDNAPNGWAYTTYIDELIEEVENDK